MLTNQDEPNIIILPYTTCHPGPLHNEFIATASVRITD